MRTSGQRLFSFASALSGDNDEIDTDGYACNAMKVMILTKTKKANTTMTMITFGSPSCTRANNVAVD